VQETSGRPPQATEVFRFGDEGSELPGESPVRYQLMFDDLFVEVIADVSPMDLVITPTDMDLTGSNRGSRGFTQRAAIQDIRVISCH